MKKINNNVFKYVNHIKKIIYNKNYIILYDDSNDKYMYLDYYIKNDISIDFNYLKRINKEDSFTLFLLNDSKYEKIDTIIDLYKKSISSIEFSIDEKKRIYDELVDKLNNIYSFYYNLQGVLENEFNLFDYHKYFLINISLIYHLLDVGYYFLKLWYKSSIENRIVLNVFDVSDNNFYNGYIINTDRCYRDNFIYEISNYYKFHYLDEKIFNEIEYFFNKFDVSLDEKYLFFCYLVIIPMIDYNNGIDCYSLIKYVKDTYGILNKYKEEEEGYQQEFKE